MTPKRAPSLGYIVCGPEVPVKRCSDSSTGRKEEAPQIVTTVASCAPHPINANLHQQWRPDAGEVPWLRMERHAGLYQCRSKAGRRHDMDRQSPHERSQIAALMLVNIFSVRCRRASSTRSASPDRAATSSAPLPGAANFPPEQRSSACRWSEDLLGRLTLTVMRDGRRFTISHGGRSRHDPHWSPSGSTTFGCVLPRQDAAARRSIVAAATVSTNLPTRSSAPSPSRPSRARRLAAGGGDSMDDLLDPIKTRPEI